MEAVSTSIEKVDTGASADRLHRVGIECREAVAFFCTEILGWSKDYTRVRDLSAARRGSVGRRRVTGLAR